MKKIAKFIPLIASGIMWYSAAQLIQYKSIVIPSELTAIYLTSHIVTIALIGLTAAALLYLLKDGTEK